MVTRDKAPAITIVHNKMIVVQANQSFGLAHSGGESERYNWERRLASSQGRGGKKR